MSIRARRYAAGDTINKWVVQELLGAGAMGAVYAVVHRVTGMQGALKVLKLSGKNADVAGLKMLAEAKLLGSQNHDNLVAVYDASDEDDISQYGYWMVMERLVGRDLSKVIEQEGPLSIDRALKYAEQIAAGAQCAHSLGVIHRDLKPDNIHVSEKEIVKVFDFGASRFRQEGATLGGVTGTFPYMSPEQLHKRTELDGRSDIFAVGMILHEMLTGRHFYKHPDGRWFDRGQVIHTILSPEPLSAFEDVDERVRPILLRTTAKDPAQRYPSMDALASDLYQLRKHVSQMYAPTERFSDAAVSSLRQPPPSPSPQPPPQPAAVATGNMTSTEAAVVARASAATMPSAHVSRGVLITIVGLALALGVVGVLLLATGGSQPSAATEEQQAADHPTAEAHQPTTTATATADATATATATADASATATTPSPPAAPAPPRPLPTFTQPRITPRPRPPTGRPDVDF